MEQQIYLDFNASTPVLTPVLEKMLPYFSQHFANSSSSHRATWPVHSAIKHARKQVAESIGAEPREIIFTSGATESVFGALFGFFQQLQSESQHGPFHVLTTKIEHACVLESLKSLASLFPIEVEYVPVDSQGRLQVQDVESRIRKNTCMICIMWVNNELGTIYPIQEIGEMAHQRKVYFLCDATQGIGKIPLNLQNTKVDLLAFASHKVYGPKGVGALYVRHHNPHVSLRPFIPGGGHENGLRSGTLNTPGIVGFGEACEKVSSTIEQDSKHYQVLRDHLVEELKKIIPHLHLNTPINESVTNTLNVSLGGLSVELLGGYLGQFAYSQGSACHSGGQSHVLKAIGLSDDMIRSSLRLSFGKSTSQDDLNAFVAALKKAKEQIDGLS
jgi:cysteine desulfurase